MTTETKVCRICNEEKHVSEFYFRKDNNKHREDCKACGKKKAKEYNDKHREDIVEKNRKYYAENKEILNKKSREYQKNNFDILKQRRNVWRETNKERIKKQRAVFYQENKDRINEAKKEWYRDNKDHHRKRQNEYDIANKERLRAARRKWENERLENDIIYKLTKNLRGRIKAALKLGGKGGKRTTDIIGCTVDEARDYLQAQFREGMSWDNYGTVWNIDHRIPVSWFNLENEHCLKAAFHYKNMQPLFCMENFLKNNKRADTIPIYLDVQKVS